MALLKPFCALRYNPQKVALSAVLAPPYDVISPEERAALQASSPHNMIHLILGQSRIGGGEQEETVYASAGEKWRRWRSDGVLTQEDTPAFYVVEQRFLHEGEEYTRVGLVAAVRLEPYDAGVIFPHEKTFAGPKQDRFRLMEAVNANLDSVFGLYDDRDANVSALIRAAQRETPILSGKSSDGQRHRVWAITDAKACEALQAAFADAPIVIADGHHRYETALNYRDARCAAEDASPDLDFVMMTLCSIRDPGLLVLPTHRMIGGADSLPTMTGAGMAQVVSVSLQSAFESEMTGAATHTMIELGKAARAGRRAYGAYFGEDAGLLLCPKETDYPRYEEIAHFTRTILDRLPEILEAPELKVDYTHSGAEAVCKVNAGDAWGVFLLQGVPVADVFEAARTGHLMPEKTTFFYPKLQSGLLMRDLESELA